MNEKFNLNEALDRVRLLKNKLNRLQTERKDLFDTLDLEDSKPERDYRELTTQIEAVHRDIIEIKSAVDEANVSHELTIKNGDGSREVNLKRAILELGRIRSELSELKSASPKRPSTRGSYLSSSDTVHRYFQPLSRVELNDLIEQLEREKAKWNRALYGANSSVTIEVDLVSGG